jgi:hypothetical protein
VALGADMTSDFSVFSLLPLASFAIAAGGLAVRFWWPAGPAKQILIAASFVFLLLASGFLWAQQRGQERQVRDTADEIVRFMGNEKRTYDEILMGLRRPNDRIVNLAVDFLIGEKRLGSEPTTIVDKSDNTFLIRRYFVRTF